MITTPALHTPKKWPGFMERVRAAVYSPVFELRKFDGSPINMHAPGDTKNPSIGIYRRKLHSVLYNYAKELGIPVTFNSRVVRFFEIADQGGVALENGRELTADVVVAADGVGSKSRAVLDGNRDAPISSGFILYRIAFPIAPALENPILAKEFAGHKDRTLMYMGPGAHMPISKSGDGICWLLTCKVCFPSHQARPILIRSRMRAATLQRAGQRRLQQREHSKWSRAGIPLRLSSSRQHLTTKFLTGSSCGATRNRNGSPKAAASCSSATQRTLSSRPPSAAAPWQWKTPTRWPHACRSAAKITFPSPPNCTTSSGS